MIPKAMVFVGLSMVIFLRFRKELLAFRHTIPSKSVTENRLLFGCQNSCFRAAVALRAADAKDPRKARSGWLLIARCLIGWCSPSTVQGFCPSGLASSLHAGATAW